MVFLNAEAVMGPGWHHGSSVKLSGCETEKDYDKGELHASYFPGLGQIIQWISGLEEHTIHLKVCLFLVFGYD